VVRRVASLAYPACWFAELHDIGHSMDAVQLEVGLCADFETGSGRTSIVRNSHDLYLPDLGRFGLWLPVVNSMANNRDRDPITG